MNDGGLAKAAPVDMRLEYQGVCVALSHLKVELAVDIHIERATAMDAGSRNPDPKLSLE